jgi:hypothetical protein
MDVPILDSVAAYAEYFAPELTARGWHIHETADSVGAGTCFKNGKPKKTPSVWLRYIEHTNDYVFEPDSGEVVTITRELTGRERPWRVDSWRLNAGKTFRDLPQAVAAFIEEVRASDAAIAKGAFSGH